MTTVTIERPTMAKKRHHGMRGHYEGMEHRRKQEMHDAGMITEDHSAVANMPQDVKYKPWPSAHSGMDHMIDDTIAGINRQMGDDESKAHRHMAPHKW